MQTQYDPKWELLLSDSTHPIRHTRAPGTQKLIQEITDDLAPLFGDVPYSVMIVDGYGYNLAHHEPNNATLWVVWWPREKECVRGWWMLLVRVDTWHNTLVRAAVTGLVGRKMMHMVKNYPKHSEYGDMDQDEWVEEVLAALFRLYPHSAKARIDAVRKMMALWGFTEIDEKTFEILK
jgi:hypothetical protein